MRQGRFLAPGAREGLRAGIYHCVSRVVDRGFVLEKREKEHFVRLMRLYERFCGVRVLAFCVMSNHFHILLEVPQRPEEGLSERAFFARLSLLYSELHVAEVRQQIQERKKARDWDGVEEVMGRYLYRMWDLSQFMKTLKQRFTQWFNKRHGRRGTLWEERFKSVIVEDGYAARVIAAYIDLNPVRAGMVKAPEKYRWSGYAEALAGKPEARVGIERVMSQFEEWAGGRRERKRWREVVSDYRVILFSDGEEDSRGQDRRQRVEVARRDPAREGVAQVRTSEGSLSSARLLRYKVKHFVDGAVIGSEAFVDEIFLAGRSRFGDRRTSGARKMRGCETSLRSLRDLRSRSG
jgi:putative transposase